MGMSRRELRGVNHYPQKGPTDWRVSTHHTDSFHDHYIADPSIELRVTKFLEVTYTQWAKMKISLSLKCLKILKNLPKLATSNIINTFKYHYFVPK